MCECVCVCVQALLFDLETGAIPAGPCRSPPLTRPHRVRRGFLTATDAWRPPAPALTPPSVPRHSLAAVGVGLRAGLADGVCVCVCRVWDAEMGTLQSPGGAGGGDALRHGCAEASESWTRR